MACEEQQRAAPAGLRLGTSKLTAPDSEEVATLDAAIASGDWGAFERVVIAFSGGKDSLACALRLLDAGVPKDKLELWHHDVDGREGSDLMDWPVTRAYCEAVADHLGVPLRFSWKVGGFEGEMLRDNAPTAPTKFELADGTIGEAGGKGPRGTRRKFPQVSADLKVRWCSAYLKIDIASKVFANDSRFKTGGRYLIVTGERREESVARSRYAEIERDRSCTKSRNVLRWRAVIDFTERDVWDLIEKYGIEPHPVYTLGFGRVSCAFCIFGNDDQWATLKVFFPKRFAKMVAYEDEFGMTIHRSLSLEERADRGKSITSEATPEEAAAVCSHAFNKPIRTESWTLPRGAFRECGGPT